MDLSKLEFFFAAADSENFTQAAEKCSIAQTTMSKYIAQLEEELDVRLFYRTTREVILTEAGHRFYAGAKELLRDYETLRRQIRQMSGEELLVGIYGEFFNLSILEEFSLSHPEISLRVIFEEKEALFDQLRRRKIHAVMLPNILLAQNAGDPSIRALDVQTDEAYFYCANELLEKHGSVQKVIEQVPYITKAKEKGYHELCRKIIRDAFGVTFHDVTVVESPARQQLLVSLSQGFAIMLRHEADPRRELYAYPLPGFNETLQLLYSVKYVPDSLKIFIDYITGLSIGL